MIVEIGLFLQLCALTYDKFVTEGEMWTFYLWAAGVITFLSGIAIDACGAINLGHFFA